MSEPARETWMSTYEARALAHAVVLTRVLVCLDAWRPGSLDVFTQPATELEGRVSTEVIGKVDAELFSLQSARRDMGTAARGEWPRSTVKRHS